MSDRTNPPPAASPLERFRRTREEAAFRAMVEQHAGMVKATALRCTGGDQSLAEDVTQEVFVLLAQRAAVIREPAALPAWLHRASCGRAVDAMKRNARRRQREQTAAEMNLHTEHERDWTELAPVLDEAVNRLPEDDRQLLVLRYFEGLSQREAGAALGLSEEAARKRLRRALDKLHATLSRRGITGTAAALGATLTAHGGPASLSSAACANLMRTSLSAPVLSGASLAFHQFLSLLAMTTKNKTAIAVASLLLASLPVALLWRENRTLRDRLAEMEKSRGKKQPSPAAQSGTNITGSSAAKQSAPEVDDSGEDLITVSLSQESIDRIDLPVLEPSSVDLVLSEAVCQLLRITPAEAARVNAALGVCESAIKKLDTAHLRRVEDKPDGVIFEIPAYPEGRPLRDALIAETEAALGPQRTAWIMPKLAYATDWQLGRFGSLSRHYDARFESIGQTAADGTESSVESCTVDIKWGWPDGPDGEASAAAEHPYLRDITQRLKGSRHRIYNTLDLVGESGADHPLGHLFRIEDIRP